MVPCFQALGARRQGIFSISDFSRYPSGGSHLFSKLSSLAQSWKSVIGCKQQFGKIVVLSNRTVNPATPIALVTTLAQVAAGEARAMNRCIDQHGGLVWAIARRYLKDGSEAEDLVQEVFTEVWKKAASFDPALASESTFIGLIARRRAIDFLRRLGRRPDFEPLSAAESLPQPTSGTPSIICDPETVKSSLATLPPDTRQLFHLFFEDGFTHPEIAEKTGLPLGTVKTRLRRGLITLKEHLRRLGTSNPQSAS